MFSSRLALSLQAKIRNISNMKQYKLINNLTGWVVFLIATTVYCLTIEPTASFWDCGEFITTGYKLEVGHPPGAPFFMLVANLFTQFASDTTQVAKMVNLMSAMMSGACILFLFWSITHLVRKLVVKDEEKLSLGKMITIMGSGVVGALAYTFSDTFWFSAVEGEVYAFSSLFTAVVFWLILKWEDVADEPHSDRWLILIAYLTGLSIGVHLLNLLCLPAIVLVYYFKKVPNANAKGSLMALAVSAVLVAVVLYGIVPGIVKVAGCVALYRTVGGRPYLGCVRKPTREEQVAHGHLVYRKHCYAGYSFLWTWHYGRSYWYGGDCLVVGVFESEESGEDEGGMAHLGSHTEHYVALHTAHRDRLFKLCTHRDTLYGQYADGSKLARGYFYAGRILRTRTVWYSSAILWPCLYFGGGTRREKRLLRTTQENTDEMGARG